ncbi:putative serine/threonine kinase [Trypanosoma cruzi]|uniref:Protein kinase, putative n=2 Tax=Trypanosoma cruzi TaxID=5693 RepID=Q4DCU8_TRYCC|nr:protein kinase, putative [Trypanosoma cruzi]EAN90342.1 protein kinase, putative [Trypanosoma cruzi]PWV17212.1 putative serine/threonine kinase [Trypanosoma cruzi]RNC40602.1 putative protein kinase [Trypanosoma cruzi]|eukprot:XP_812193.1 protein kinase [Trypanosoma cruzi strain CL Brener]
MNGRYVPQEVLGTGTYGRVLRCNDVLTGRQVAVKVSQRDAAYRRSAMNEIRVLQLLSHTDNALKMFDFFEDSGHLCIASELLCTDFYEVLRKNGFQPLSLDTVRIVGERVLRALAELHKAGYMHCDIKPANVMLRFNETDRSNLSDFTKTCLIDFGAARQFHENTYYDVQSLWYRAPEVMLGLPYTSHIDSWSVGCLLFELYTGKPLFAGENPREQMTSIMCTVGMPPMEAFSSGANVEKLQLPCLAMDVNAEANLRNLIASYRCNNTGFNHSYQLVGEESAFVNLLCALLQPDVRWRLSCTDALHHAFFTSRCLYHGNIVSANFSVFSPSSNGLQSSIDSNFGAVFSSTGNDARGFGGFEHLVPQQTQPHPNPHPQPRLKSESSPILPANSNSVPLVGLVGSPPGMVLPGTRPPASSQVNIPSSRVVLQNVMYPTPPMKIIQPVPFNTQQSQKALQQPQRVSANMLPVMVSAIGNPYSFPPCVRPECQVQNWEPVIFQPQQQIPPEVTPMFQCKILPGGCQYNYQGGADPSFYGASIKSGLHSAVYVPS